MDKNIEAYIINIVSELNCSEKEKSETAEEMKDHLILLKNEYVELGFSDEEASQKALQSFGDEKNIKEGFQYSLYPYFKFFRIVTLTVFSLYSLVLFWNLLLMRILERIINNNSFNRFFWFPQDSKSFFNLEVWKLNSNIIPFKNTYEYITGLNRFNLDIIIHNTLGNVLIFIPLGIFLPILFKSYKSFSKLCISSFLITITIELSQFFLQIGQFDIDDIILNAIGSVIGYFVIRFIIKISNYISWNVLRKTTN